MQRNGDQAKLSSYPFLGAEIHAVADGVVTSAEDGAPEQVPGKLPADATLQNAAGNHVDGLPYTFASFVGDGVVTSEARLWKGAPTPIDAKALSGKHGNQLPLRDQLVTFPE